MEKEEYQQKTQADAGVEELAGEDSGGKNGTPEISDAVPQDPVSELLKKLDEQSAEAKAAKERYLRTVADLENFRKRAIREKDDVRLSAKVGLVEDLLPVLDNFRLGLESAASHEGGEAFVEGFKMVLNQLEGVLETNGVESLVPAGELFDPNLHEAVSHAPSDSVAEGRVLDVHRAGYRMQGRLVRPATVVVSSGPLDASKVDESSEQ